MIDVSFVMNPHSPASRGRVARARAHSFLSSPGKLDLRDELIQWNQSVERISPNGQIHVDGGRAEFRLENRANCYYVTQIPAMPFNLL